jgi:ribosomal protein S18 acetylase RimI-like enzyme
MNSYKRWEMSKIMINKAKEKDIEPLIDLMMNATNKNKEWSEYRAKKFVINKDKDRLILIAKDNNKLIGYMGIKEYEDNPARDFVNLKDYIWITWIAILPKYRDKGLGSILLKSAEKYAKEFMKTGILLNCKEKVITFYDKNGYSRLGEYNDKGASRYVLSKKLK